MQAMHAAGRRAPVEGIAVMMPLFDALPPDLRERARRVAATYDAVSVATSTAFMASEAHPFASAAELVTITAPALLVPGIDPYHPAEVAELYARHLPHCTVRSVEPTSFASAIADFMGALPRSA
jgi:hypothetical protein